MSHNFCSQQIFLQLLYFLPMLLQLAAYVYDVATGFQDLVKQRCQRLLGVSHVSMFYIEPRRPALFLSFALLLQSCQ